MAEFVTLSWLKEPYPNNEEVISSDAISNAIVAGKLKNKLNSNALFWIKSIFFLFFWLMCFYNCGSITTPIAIPAIAKLIW